MSAGVHRARDRAEGAQTSASPCVSTSTPAERSVSVPTRRFRTSPVRYRVSLNLTGAISRVTSNVPKHRLSFRDLTESHSPSMAAGVAVSCRRRHDFMVCVAILVYAPTSSAARCCRTFGLISAASCGIVGVCLRAQGTATALICR